MRVFTVLLCLLLAGSLTVLGQNQQPTEIAKRILLAKSIKAKFQKASVFEAEGEVKAAGKFKSMVANGQLLHLDLAALQGLFKANHEAIKFDLPLPEKKKMTLELVRHKLLTDDFSVVTSSSGGVPINWQPGIYYRGIVEGDPTSLAAISIFDGEVMGVISTVAEGDMVLGKTDSKANATDYIFYKERDLLLTNDFHCETEDTSVDTSKDPAEAGSSKVAKCVRAYLECEYDLVTEKGGATGATNFITGLFNVVALLYQNEQITTTLSQVFTWTTPDSYPTSSTSAALNSFKSTRPNYNGDVAHLISRGAPSGGGIAWVDALCSSYGYAYSYINSTYQDFPTYTWSVEVVTHEMGHNLGSPHTHACAWNGNNTAIDGCGPAAGANEGCNAAMPPPGGGTIMSYCHLVNGVGISFTNGFGTQPGNRVRTEVTNGSCLVVCGNACQTVTVTGSNVSCNGGNNGTASASTNSSHSPFTYAWSNGGNTATISNLPAGTYTVTVTDATGCTGTGSRTVSQPAGLTLTTVVTNASSGNNGAIDLTVTGGTAGYAYAWSNGATTQDITGLAAGTYTVTVTDAGNCTGTKSATVANSGGGGSGGGSCSNTISSFPYNESFESGLGLWTQNANDQMNWTRQTGGTPTANTGPNGAQAGSYYLYTEATGFSPNYSGILTGPCFNLAGVSNPNLTFQYHMYGSTTGTLKVEASTNNGSTWTAIWTKTGNQGNAWFPATVSLASYQGTMVQLRFSGTTGSSYYSDMAIDAVSVSGSSSGGGGCNNPPLLTFAVTNTSNGLNNGAINLSVANGTAPFTYAWSNSATTQDLSNLAPGTYSLTCTDAGSCVVNGSATVENGSTGGTCMPLITIPNNNGFENGAGDWAQAANDNMDWTIQSGGTPTSYTGPNSAYAGTKYAYTEATNNSGKTAILLSSCYDLSTVNEPFISFGYHMYGGSMGTLKLEISTNSGSTWTTIWSRTGHQGTGWRSAVIYLNAYKTQIVKFRFLGMVAGNTSDMALDAITVSTASHLPEGFEFAEVAEMPVQEQGPTLSLRPNPAKHDLNVRFEAEMEQEGQVFVTDQAGKIMREESIRISKGENNLLLSVEDLPAGMYFLLLRAGENSINEKFVVLK